MNETPETETPKRAYVKKVQLEPLTKKGADKTQADLLKEQGIPVFKAWFKQTVRNENYLGLEETIASRQASLTLTPMGLLVDQPTRKPALVPMSNINWLDFA